MRQATGYCYGQALTPTDKPQGIFGVPLNVSIKYANVAISLTNDNGESFIYGYVPIVVAKCGVFLKEKGLSPSPPPAASDPCLTAPATDVEGIFRLNGSAKRIKDLQEIFDSPERYGKGLDWTGYTVHDAANVLRRYLNQLPEPIVPLEFYERFREPLGMYQQLVQANGSADEPFDHPKAVASYQQLIRDLPPLNKQLLLYILDLLAVFASKSELNRMPSANLAAIFQPGLLSHPNHYMSPDEYKLSQDVLIFLIENQDHFLFGMNGTAADEETLKEVESGLTPRPAAYSNVRRSASTASNGRESLRKYDGLRRNVSVSSKNSRNSNNAAGSGAPQSLNGVAVHRSNTVPSKKSPAMPPSRLRPADPPAAHAPGLAPPARNSRPASRTPPLDTSQAPDAQEGPVLPGSSGISYTHSSTHGPVPRRSRDQSSEKPHLAEGIPPVASPPPPPAVVTPTKERKISNFFSRSPPPSVEQKEARQPNRLKKRRVPGSASESAQSSSLSLQAATTDSSLNATSHSVPTDSANEAGGATPKPAATSNPEEAKENAAPDESGPPATDSSLRPPDSRTPSMSSFTDRSDAEAADEAAKERKDHRRSWKFPRSSKRSNDQLGLGVGSPPLVATTVPAEGGWHHPSKSPPSELQQFAPDPSAQPLSLDAELHDSKDASHGDHERKSLFGKFKAKVAQVREGVRERELDREKSKSPVQSEASIASRTVSPTGRDSVNGKLAPIEVKESKDEQPSSPVTPMPSSGPPPAIPEEPITPEKAVPGATGPDSAVARPDGGAKESAAEKPAPGEAEARTSEQSAKGPENEART